jgi:large subunit ribosomal protein L1
MKKIHGKKYAKVASLIDGMKLYGLTEAIDLAQKTSYVKFDASVDVAINLGVDPRHADQNVRGAVALPHGLGKTVRIVVFAKGEKAIEAKNYGVEFVGGDDLADKIKEGWMDFDQVVSTPDMMAVVGKLGRILGPRGLMPNPKMGTVTFDLKQAIEELKTGRAEFRVDKNGIVHTCVGKTSMPADKLQDNVKAVVDAVLKAKPQSSKGTYLKKISLSATMGPGIKVDAAPFRA